MKFVHAFFALGAVVARVASADNLLLNSDFNSTTNSWAAFGPASVALGSTDSNGSSASRSAVVTHTGTAGTSGNGSFAGLSQCVPTVAGRAYTVAFASQAPPGTPQANDRAGVRVEFFTGTSCSGESGGTQEIPVGFSVGAFDTFVLTGITTSPAGTYSARVAFGLFKRTAGNLTATYDALHFGESRPKTVVVPASASIAGANGTYFRTALWAYNASPNRVTQATASFRCVFGADCDKTSTFEVGVGATYHVPDFVSSLGADSAAGGLEFTYDEGYATLTFLTRTYSPSLDGPSTGSTLRGLQPGEARTRSVLPGLASSAGPSSGFRTNVGTYNPGAADATVTVQLFNAVGSPCGTAVAMLVPARRSAQANDVAAQAGCTAVSNILHAYVDSTVPVFSYATVIDNASADSMIVTGEAVPPATAVNLLTNPGFRSSADGWSLEGSGSVTWASEGDSDEGPGSAIVASTAAAANSTTALTQCVRVTPGKQYSLAFSFRRPAGQASGTRSASVSGEYYAGSSCAGTPLTVLNSLRVDSATAPTAFINFAVPYGSPAPAFAGSARLRFGVLKADAGGSAAIQFDAVWFSEADFVTAVVPAAASIHGANDAFFHTSFWSTSLTAEHNGYLVLNFRCLAGAPCDYVDFPLGQGHRGMRYFADLVGYLGREEQAGAIEVQWDRAFMPTAILTRTYSPALPAPTTGSQVPAVPASEARMDSVLIGLAGSADGSVGFRTNVGGYNPGGSTGTVTITVYDANGRQVGQPYQTTVASRRPFQVNNVFQAVGEPAATGNAFAAVVSSSVALVSYATVIDNRSADSVIVIGGPR